MRSNSAIPNRGEPSRINSSSNQQSLRNGYIQNVVDNVPVNLRGEALATYLERRLPEPSELYLAARYIHGISRQANLLNHSRALRGYLNISNRLRNIFASSTQVIPERKLFEALSWAAPRLVVPYQERAIDNMQELLQGKTREKTIEMLVCLGNHFSDFNASDGTRIARRLLTPSMTRTMPSAVMAPFFTSRLSVLNTSTVPNAYRAASSPEHRQLNQPSNILRASNPAALSVNERDRSGLTNIERYLKNINVATVRLVAVQKILGADFQLPDRDGNTLLHRTIVSGNLAGVRILLDNGVSVNALNTRTTTGIANYAISAETMIAAMNRPNWGWADVDQATPLHLAAAFCPDPEMIHTLIRHGANVSALNSDQSTPLHWATVLSGRPEIIGALLEHGAEIDARDANNNTPLHLAISTSAPLVMAEALINFGANIAAVTSGGLSPVELAVIVCAPSSSEQLKALKAGGADIEIPDQEGNTLLHRLVIGGNANGIKMLLMAGAKVNAWNIRTTPAISRYAIDPHIMRIAMQPPGWAWSETDQATPLHLAAAFATNPAITRNLIEHGASISALNSDQSPPLAWAAALSRSSSAIEVLVEHGADLNERYANGWTPLTLAAASYADPGIIRSLIHFGADVDAVNGIGNSAVFYALNGEHSTMSATVADFKNAGANLELADPDGNTILHRLVMGNNSAGIEVLLAQGVNVNAMNTRITPDIARYSGMPDAVEAAMIRPNWSWNDNDQATPLHLAAAFSNSPSIVRMLTRHGANVRALNEERSTPMHWAAILASDPGVVEALIECGAEINAQNMNGMSPLHLGAAFSTHPGVVKALIDGGALVESRATGQSTPLHLAAAMSTNPLVMSVLLEHGANVRSVDGDSKTALAHALARDEPPAFVAPLLAAGAELESVANIVSPEVLEADFAYALQLQEDELQQSSRNDEEAGPSRAHIASGSRALPTPSASMTTAAQRPTMQVNQSPPVQVSIPPGYLTVNLVRHVQQWYGPALDVRAEARVRAWYGFQNEENAAGFSDFLAELPGTAEYRQVACRPALVQRVATILDELAQHPELRRLCFELVQGADASCGDRVTLALNAVEMARINHRAERGMYNTNDLVDMRTGMFRLHVLEEVARKKIIALQNAARIEAERLGGAVVAVDVEEIEVMLGFQTMLAEHYNLPAVAQAMLYARSSCITSEDLQKAKESIAGRESTDEYIEFIASWDPWRNNLKRIYPAIFERLDRDVEIDRESLSIQPEYTNSNDYMVMCQRMESMQTARYNFKVNNLTRECVVKYRSR